MSTPNRHIRLGVVYRGQIIHEETIDRRIPISIGRRAGSTIHIAQKSFPDFPEYIEFLALDNNAYHLVLAADQAPRITLRGGQADPVTINGKRMVPIETLAGGSMVVGDVVIMFQFVRGDTTPMETRESVVLRLGLVFDERLIDDRIFPDDKMISVGNARTNTIVLPDEDYQGPSLVFVNNKDGSVNMKAPNGMKIRLAVDGVPMELKDLQAKGTARQEGNDIICHLKQGTRGRATMGQHTLLFQLVKRSVTVPVMQTRSPTEKVVAAVLNEPAWWISFGVSFLLILGIIFQAHYFEKTTNKFLKARQEEQANRGTFEQIIELKEEVKVEEEKAEEKKPTTEIIPAEVKAKEEKKPEKVEKKAEAKADTKADAKPQSVGEKIDPTERTARAQKAVEEKTVAGAFKGLGSSKFYQDAGEGETGEVVAKSFGGTGGDAGEGKGPGNAGVKLQGGSAAGGTVEKVAKGKTGGFERKADETKTEVKKTEETVQIKLSGETTGSGEAKADVAKVVSRKNSAVQRCYEQALRDNPDTGGKVKVTFTVGTEGTVTDVSISGASGGFADCIKSKFESIRGLPQLSSPQTFGQSYVFSKGG